MENEKINYDKWKEGKTYERKVNWCRRDKYT